MLCNKASTLTCFTMMFCYTIMSVSGIPEEPITCTCKSCTITNSYGSFPDRSICKAANALYPTTEQELIDAIASAAKAGAKIKVATQTSHSIPKLVCPDGDQGWLISTKYLNHVVKIERLKMEITVESGMLLKEFINEAANVGLALPYSPYWSGLTVGGMLGTGAHGSSLWGEGSSVHDYVVSVRIVSPGSAQNGYVNVRDLDSVNNLTDLNAVRTNLGVLGVISKMTFKLQPMFKRSITYKTESDSDLADIAAKFGQEHEFADIIWYPSQNKAVYRIDDRVPFTTSGDGLFDFTGFRPQSRFLLGLIRSTEESQELLQFADGKCASATAFTFTLISSAFGLTNFNDVLFTGYPVIGYQNRLQASSSCLDGHGANNLCAWDPRANGQYFFQTTFSVTLTKVQSFIQDIQTLVKQVPKSMCGMDIYLGILMRYVKASNSYLGKEEDSIDFDMTYYRSKEPMSPRMFEDVYEEIEQMGVFKYGGLPHWGKNRNLAFIGAIDKYKNRKEFLKVKERYDPEGLFSSEWTDRVLGLKDGLTVDKDGCALEGMCICSKDSHCAPRKGYLCKQGRVYEDARVCRNE